MLIGAVGQVGTPGYVLVRFLRQGDPDTPVEPIKSVEPADRGSVQEVAWLEALASTANYINTVRLQQYDAETAKSTHEPRLIDRNYRIEKAYRKTGNQFSQSPWIAQSDQEPVSGQKVATSTETTTKAGSYEHTLKNLVDVIHLHVSDAVQSGNLSVQQIETLSQLQDQITDTLTSAAGEFSRSDSMQPMAFLDHLQDAVNRTSRFMQTGADRGSIEAHSAQTLQLALDAQPTPLETLRQAFGAEVVRLKEALDSGTTEPAKSNRSTRIIRFGRDLRAYRDSLNDTPNSDDSMRLNAVA
ncbi:MAG: hypothetical protein JW828_00880 [Sedimentisphaerales bacterium]|nr:hypothetical protein [Sedimentisphaerales bacterium]